MWQWDPTRSTMNVVCQEKENKPTLSRSPSWPSQAVTVEGRKLKWINSKYFLRIVNAGEQHKGAENSLQVDNNHSPLRDARTRVPGAGVRSAGR